MFLFCLGLIWEKREQTILYNFVNWTDIWEQEKWKQDEAVKKVLLSNKYKNVHSICPQNSHMYSIHYKEIVNRRSVGWIIFCSVMFLV